MHLCLIDDDAALLATLSRGLSELGHECETFTSATAGVEHLLHPGSARPDVLLLDVMMPDLDGWEALARLRAGGFDAPVIYLSARREVDDRVRGLDLGADDYMVKPFALMELVARINAVVRRRGQRAPFTIGGLVVHRDRPRVELDGRTLDTSLREHAFLELLFSEPERVFSKAELLHELWEIDFDPRTNVVEVFIARLRRKLGPTCSGLVETVVREGYRLARETPQ
ncbi:Transcriptional activator protein CopR [Planctomycetes bacterium Pla163]|uniref:Transcriptional activator protein CopR n=1 Tax=Rohdeia mirabilis TaxID=2528008 RepID=A0A518CUX8_9BACT|nr:Transcriptional activator protein CopR [Planctomycetes bacterium Pla163]